jgi:pSer/pThr/pTyr-binding forkhead associated (FHA) protein
MPKMVVSIDGVVIKEVQLTKDRTTLGRRPYNDIVIDNLAVSGEHAALQMEGGEVYLEDLNSTNGTYVNGKAAKKQVLHNGDTVEVGKYQIRFVNDTADYSVEMTPLAEAVAVAPVQATIKVMSGAAAGREVFLTKVVTTIGKPGVAVAAITHRQRGFFVHHVEGGGSPALNGVPIGSEPVALKNGDLIELAGTQMQFVQS